MNDLCPHLGVLDHLDVVPFSTIPKIPTGSENMLHPEHTVPVRTDMQLLSHSCAALIYCVRTLIASSAHVLLAHEQTAVYF